MWLKHELSTIDCKNIYIDHYHSIFFFFHQQVIDNSVYNTKFLSVRCTATFIRLFSICCCLHLRKLSQQLWIKQLLRTSKEKTVCILLFLFSVYCWKVTADFKRYIWRCHFHKSMSWMLSLKFGGHDGWNKWSVKLISFHPKLSQLSVLIFLNHIVRTINSLGHQIHHQQEATSSFFFSCSIQLPSL